LIKNINQKLYYYLFPFLLGGVTSFSLPPYNFLYINFFTFPALLFILIKIQKKPNSIWLNFKIGWLFGIGYFLSNIYWIVYSLTFEDIFKPFIPIALILIPSFLGLFYGFITLVVSRFKLRKNFSSILIFSLIFGLTEFFRGFIFGGFPWNLIVYSWTNYLNSLQILSIIGTYSLNLISITIFLIPLIIIFKKNKPVFCYCISEYPLEFKKIKWNEAVKYDGFSDHTEGIVAPILYCILKKQKKAKSVYIEKHVKLKNSRGPDASTSIDTEMFHEMISYIRTIEKIQI